MKLYYLYDYKKAPDNYTIKEAVERECYDEYTGSVADMALGTANNTYQLVGRLVEVLHDRGCLFDEDVLKILGGSFKKVD